MFPTLSDLLYHFFHFRLPFPVQTFGFFVALAFLGAYQVFTAEFKRYEAAGKVSVFKRTIVTGIPASSPELAVNFLLGFALGYKLVGAVLHYTQFQVNPRNYILSLQGNVIGGLLAGVFFSVWVYLDRRKKLLAAPLIEQKTVHPYQLMGRIVLAVGVAGVIGSKLFDVIEHTDELLNNPGKFLLSSSGFAYYGGLIFGALTYLYIGYHSGMKLVHLADIGSPGMMLAYGIGRIGCQLSGDGDWGIVNRHVQPAWLGWLPGWTWSFRFPHNTINAGLPIAGCEGSYCNELIYGVYPSSLYEAVLCVGFFFLMWAFRYRIVIPGLMFCIYLILNGAERFLIEYIRVNTRHNVLGWALTQAQAIGLLMVFGGFTGILYIIIRRRSLQSSLHD